jgi:transcriptional regulator NrdR family protein
MICPMCKDRNTFKVARTLRGTDCIVRMLECLSCGYRYFSGETILVGLPPASDVIVEKSQKDNCANAPQGGQE